MSFSQSDIDKALAYADEVRFKAALDPSDKTIVFSRTIEIPDDLHEEVAELLEIAVQYYQRSIFTAEYVMEDDDPPVRPSGDPIDDINFYLGYYKSQLTKELKKAFDLDDNLKIVQDGPKLTPYAQAMLDYRKKMMAKMQKGKKK